MEQKIDLRIKKTYLALSQAFTELLEEKMFEDITVNELCDKAMIRRTTFYKHFADKYEYYAFFLQEHREKFKLQVTATTPSSDLIKYSSDMLCEMFKFVRTHKKMLDHIKKSNMMPFLYQTFQDQIASELKELLFSNGKYNKLTPEQELLVSFYSGGLISTVYWWLENPDTLDDNAIAEEIFKITVPPTL